jgi:hypothetical protein
MSVREKQSRFRTSVAGRVAARRVLRLAAAARARCGRVGTVHSLKKKKKNEAGGERR